MTLAARLHGLDPERAPVAPDTPDGHWQRWRRDLEAPDALIEIAGTLCKGKLSWPVIHTGGDGSSMPALAVANVPFVAHRHELPHPRLIAHGLAVLDILVSLPDGWHLGDGWPDNCAWDPSDGRAKLIDWGSPIQASGAWRGLKSFCEGCVYPAVLAAATGVDPGTWLRASNGAVPASTVRGVLGMRRFTLHPIVQMLVRAGTQTSGVAHAQQKKPLSAHKLADALRLVLRGLSAMPARRRCRRLGGPSTAWTNHSALDSYTPEAERRRTSMLTSFARHGGRLRRILDLGAHSGALSRAVIECTGVPFAVAVERDPLVAESLSGALPDAVVVCSDFADNDLLERLQRYAPDFMIVCGLIHHAAVADGWGLERALNKILAIAGEKLVFEWVNPEDPRCAALLDVHAFVPGRYRRDDAWRLISGRYDVEVVDLPPGYRELWLCRQKPGVR